ncbi:hypothetical protein DICVIV_10427 [Dictyocaulus viviparus]|uniref:A-kinase anchor protein 17A n=1 Tax=Dictyocaulus viviparus TaxID=29172 RepID=A0A0D8XME4_DICVI|nr:hypothetical protein DICVIV_10427 [Dictyocaulus viviparus]
MDDTTHIGVVEPLKKETEFPKLNNYVLWKYPKVKTVMEEYSLGSEAVSFCPELELYLSPLSRIEINIKLPKFTIPGQSISNWDLMERLKKGVAPVQFSAIRVTESSLEGVTLEADLPTKKIMKQANLDLLLLLLADPVRVRAAEAKSDFPSRHDWDLFYMKNKLDERKAGERPDTIYMAKIPIKWFAEKGFDLPSEDLLRLAMETFGSVRMVDIPICDEVRKEMSSEISGIRNKGFGLGPDVFFEAYVQFTEYSGFVNAMDSLRNMKWLKRIDKKVFHANIKYEIERLKKESERQKREEEKRLAKELAEKRRRQMAARVTESCRLLEAVFTRIQRKEDRRKEIQEARLKAEQRVVELEDIPTSEKEQFLRAMLLRQREISMREKLKQRMRQAREQKGTTTNIVKSSRMRRDQVDSLVGEQSSGESSEILSHSDQSCMKKRQSSTSNSSAHTDVDKGRKKRCKSESDDTDESDAGRKRHRRRSSTSTSSENGNTRRSNMSRHSCRNSKDNIYRVSRKKHRVNHRKSKKRRRSK